MCRRNWGPGIEDANEGFGREDKEQADELSGVPEDEIAAVVRWASEIWDLSLDVDNEYRHAVAELKSATQDWINTVRYCASDLGWQSGAFLQALVRLGGAFALDVGVGIEALIRTYLLFCPFE